MELQPRDIRMTATTTDQHELMTIQEIADHLRRTKDTVKRVYVTQPGFPRPIRKMGGVKIQPLYYRHEVMDFLKNQQE